MQIKGVFFLLLHATKKYCHTKLILISALHCENAHIKKTSLVTSNAEWIICAIVRVVVIVYRAIVVHGIVGTEHHHQHGENEAIDKKTRHREITRLAFYAFARHFSRIKSIREASASYSCCQLVTSLTCHDRPISE